VFHIWGDKNITHYAYLSLAFTRQNSLTPFLYFHPESRVSTSLLIQSVFLNHIKLGPKIFYIFSELHLCCNHIVFFVVNTFYSMCYKCIVYNKNTFLCFRKPTALKDSSGPPTDHLLRFLLHTSSDVHPTCANCDNKNRVAMYYCNTCGKLKDILKGKHYYTSTNTIAQLMLFTMNIEYRSLQTTTYKNTFLFCKWSEKLN